MTRHPRLLSRDNPALANVIEGNIETMLDVRDAEERGKSRQDRLADLQIDLLAEYEITQILRLVAAIGEKLEVAGCDTAELAQLREPITVRDVIEEMRVRGLGSERLG